MRVTMPDAGWRRSEQVASWPFGQRGAVLFLACCLFATPHVSAVAPSATPAPAKPGRKNPPQAANTLEPAAAPTDGKPELAVVYDDVYRSPAKDLLLSADGEHKAEANARFINGILLEEVSETDRATEEYGKALALDPTNIELAIKVAWEYLRRGDTPGALDLLKNTAKAAPKSARVPLALANIYFNNLNKVDQALKYSQQALELDPANISGYEYLRDLYKATGQTQKTSALLDRAAKVDTKDAMFWLRLGALYADAYLQDDPAHNADDLRKTTAVFQKALATGNNDVEIIGKIADFFVATQQLAEAVPLYRRIIDIDPNQNAARENLARCYLGLNDSEKAAATLEELIKVNPVQPRAYETLAKIYEAAGQMEKAAADYEQSLLISPNEPGTYESLVRRLWALKKPSRAVTILNEARRRFPDVPAFTFMLAVSLEEAKQHQQALAMYEQTEAEARHTNNSGLLDSQFYFNFGVSAEQSGLYDRAATLLEKSLTMEDDPRQIANASNYLGFMWVDHDQNLEKGGDLIKKAVELEPDNGAYLDSLGWYYYKTSRYPDALAQLQLAIEKLKPEDPVVYEHLGDTYLKLNDTPNALESWLKAMELDPLNPDAVTITKKIADAKAGFSPTPATAAPKS